MIISIVLLSLLMIMGCFAFLIFNYIQADCFAKIKKQGSLWYLSVDLSLWSELKNENFEQKFNGLLANYDIKFADLVVEEDRKVAFSSFVNENKARNINFAYFLYSIAKENQIKQQNLPYIKEDKFLVVSEHKEDLIWWQQLPKDGNYQQYISRKSLFKGNSLLVGSLNLPKVREYSLSRESFSNWLSGELILASNRYYIKGDIIKNVFFIDLSEENKKINYFKELLFAIKPNKSVMVAKFKEKGLLIVTRSLAEFVSDKFITDLVGRWQYLSGMEIQVPVNTKYSLFTNLNNDFVVWSEDSLSKVDYKGLGQHLKLLTALLHMQPTISKLADNTIIKEWIIDEEQVEVVSENGVDIIKAKFMKEEFRLYSRNIPFLTLSNNSDLISDVDAIVYEEIKLPCSSAEEILFFNEDELNIYFSQVSPQAYNLCIWR